MNKIIVILVILIFLAGGAYLYLNINDFDSSTADPDSPNNTQETTPVESEQENVGQEFESNDGSGQIQINSLLVRDPGDIFLYSNLKDQLTSSEAMAKNDCSDMVTAGFYTKDFKHIGLLISEYNRLSDSKPTLQSSGFFSIDGGGHPSIEVIEPLDARIAVQSYPIVYQDGQPVEVKDNVKDKARRIVAATTSDNDVVFLVFYIQDSVYNGPTLSELPDLIKQYDDKEKTDFVDAINLDGGTHSVFISKYTKLKELSTIGSYFCMRY